MDISELNILQCQKSEEIQKEWKPTPGDFFYRKFTIFGEEIDRQIWKEEQAREINIIYWKSQVEGYWACTNEEGVSRIYKHPADMRRETSIWLPRQDELQEMVVEHNSLVRYIALFHDFVMNAFYESSSPTNKQMGSSMESLWLAFVMKHKFNKVWDSQRKQWVR